MIGWHSGHCPFSGGCFFQVTSVNGLPPTNFSYEMLDCQRFLDPVVNQKTTYTKLQREGLVQKVLFYAMAMFRRRQATVTEVNLAQELGEFTGRTGNPQFYHLSANLFFQLCQLRLLTPMQGIGRRRLRLAPLWLYLLPP